MQYHPDSQSPGNAFHGFVMQPPPRLPCGPCMTLSLPAVPLLVMLLLLCVDGAEPPRGAKLLCTRMFPASSMRPVAAAIGGGGGGSAAACIERSHWFRAAKCQQERSRFQSHAPCTCIGSPRGAEQQSTSKSEAACIRTHTVARLRPARVPARMGCWQHL